jgi:formate/nitrite transporter FocA (FNT family)
MIVVLLIELYVGGLLSFCFTLFFIVFSIAKKIEPMNTNTLASSVWWVFGFYLIVVGGQPLLEDSLCLYW